MGFGNLNFKILNGDWKCVRGGGTCLSKMGDCELEQEVRDGRWKLEYKGLYIEIKIGGL